MSISHRRTLTLLFMIMNLVVFATNVWFYLNTMEYDTIIVSDGAGYSNTRDWRNNSIGVLDFIVLWYDEPVTGIMYSIQDEDFNVILSSITEYDTTSIDLSEYCENGLYYLNITFTADFNLGGTETHYMYYLFNCDLDTEDNLAITQTMSPAIWRKEPTTLLKEVEP